MALLSTENAAVTSQPECYTVLNHSRENKKQKKQTGARRSEIQNNWDTEGAGGGGGTPQALGGRGNRRGDITSSWCVTVVKKQKVTEGGALLPTRSQQQ